MTNKKKPVTKAVSNRKGQAIRPSLPTLLSTWWKDQSTALQFLGLFALLLGLFYAFYFSSFNIQNLQPSILNGQARIGAFLLRLMGQPVQAVNQFINGDKFSMNVSGGCDGLEVTALLIAGILAFPSSWREKSKGLLYGVAFLTVLNIMRLPVLYFAGAKGSMALFDFLHVQGGFVIFISITMLIWGYWVIQVLNQRKKGSGALEHP